jgi:hypothetical protein
MDAATHSHHSRLRERIVEHIFVGDVLRVLWRSGVTDIEVLRSEFDVHGYDLVMVRGNIVRHIQFKTGTSAKPGNISVPLALATKPSGCVLWIRITPDLDLKSFFWFGNTPGKPLPAIRHYAMPLRPTRDKSGNRPPRRNHRLVPPTAFTRINALVEVIETLFGSLPEPTSGDPASHAQQSSR